MSRLGCALGLLWCAASHAQPAVPPPGTTLPVALEETLDARTAKPGEPIHAGLIQRVPLPGGGFLPAKAKLTGSVVAVDARTLTLRFDALTLDGQSAPVRVRLLAAAFWREADRTKDPLGAPDRGTSNPSQWTTEQLGGDEVYRANGVGKVYNRVSEPVGHADGVGVYGFALKPGGPERAMGPFSTTSAGLYGLDGLAFGTQTPAAAAFTLTGPGWKLHAHDALLFEITP